MIFRTPLQLDQIKQQIIQLVKEGQKSLRLDTSKSAYWNNHNLVHNSSEILGSSKVNWYLNYALEQNTLGKIQNYIEPIAVDIYFSNQWEHWVQFRLLDLATLSFLVSPNETIRAQNYMEYEIWQNSGGTGCNYGDEIRKKCINAVFSRLESG